MHERFVDIKTAAGSMETFITHPEEHGPFPAVIIYMDVWGVREELYDIARRVGTVGYYCMVPDFYYRQGKVRFEFRNDKHQTISMSRLDEETRRKVRMPLQQLSNTMVMDDTGAILDFLKAGEPVRDGGMGSIGYCMGGRHVLCAAGTYPEHFIASASLHGTTLISNRDDSPHRLVNTLSISAALLLAMSQAQPALAQNGTNHLVQQAIAAEGGADALRALKGLAIKGEARFWEPEQSEKADGEPRFLGDATFTVTWDVAKGMARTDWDRDQKYPAPVRLKYTETVSPTLGYVTNDKGSQAMSGLRVAAHLRELERASPWLLVKAMDAPKSVAALGNQSVHPCLCAIAALSGMPREFNGLLQGLSWSSEPKVASTQVENMGRKRVTKKS